MAKKRKKPKMEFRYYQMPAGSPILALLGQKWVQNYGNDVDYLHFHNYLEIGFCYEGDGVMAFGEAKMRFSGREFTVIPPNYAHINALFTRIAIVLPFELYSNFRE